MNKKCIIHQKMFSWQNTKMETGGNNNGTIVQWLVKRIILLEQLYLIFVSLCINVQSIE